MKKNKIILIILGLIVFCLGGYFIFDKYKFLEKLGFIKNNKNEVEIIMTLTAPNCPEAESLPYEVKTEIQRITGIQNVTVTITFDPPWDMNRMSEAAKLELGFL